MFTNLLHTKLNSNKSYNQYKPKRKIVSQDDLIASLKITNKGKRINALSYE